MDENGDTEANGKLYSIHFYVFVIDLYVYILFATVVSLYIAILRN